VIFHDVFSVDEAYNKAMKIERLQNKASPFKSIAEKTSSNIRAQQGSTSGEQPPAHKVVDASTANPVTANPPTTKGKENPYAKPGVDKYYRCGESEHKSNECPKWH